MALKIRTTYCIVIFTYLAFAVFFCLHVQVNNLNHVWIWNAGDSATDVDRVMHDVPDLGINWPVFWVKQIVCVVCLLVLLASVKFLSPSYGKARKWFQENFLYLAVASYLCFATTLFLYIPCTIVQYHYAYRTISNSDFRWVWQIGTASVNLQSIVLEQIALIFIFIAAYSLIAVLIPSMRPRRLLANYSQKIN